MNEFNYFLEDDLLIIDRWNSCNCRLDESIYEIMKNVSTIDFDYYSYELPCKLPNNIKKIVFQCNLNYNICDYLPDGLEELELYNEANFPIDNLPKTLKKLTLGYRFNQKIDNLPSELEEINMFDNEETDTFFDQYIDNLPKNLKKLILSQSFNKPVDNLPSGLQLLIFKYDFDQSIDYLPDRLRTLRLDRCFTRSLDNLPSGLDTLICSPRRYKRDIINLPSSLKILCWITSNFRNKIILPERLDIFFYDVTQYFESYIPEIIFSNNLRTFIFKEYDGDLNELPDSLENLAIGYEYNYHNIKYNFIEVSMGIGIRVPLLPRKLPKNLKKLYLPWIKNLRIIVNDNDINEIRKTLRFYKINYPSLRIFRNENIKIKLT